MVSLDYVKKNKSDSEWIFWTTIIISFVMLIHNGTEPLFLFAYASMPFLIVIFYLKRNFYVIAIYLLLIGALGRYTEYYHSVYGSDVLLAVRDFVGYFVNGKNVYKEMTMTVDGVIPFSYLPFNLFWYLPAYALRVDFRFFEMIVSMFVPVCIFIYGLLVNRWKILPILAVISLTPFLIDLSADGSNDNSAIFLLLTSVIFFVHSYKNTNKRSAIISAILLGVAMSFKHYIFFFILFFVQFLFMHKQFIKIGYKRYLSYAFITAGIIIMPFFIASPDGFIRSFIHIEGGTEHPTWGWNIWVALRDLFKIAFSNDHMRLIRFILTIAIGIVLFRYFPPRKFNFVFINTCFVMLVFFIFSKWTTIAYFTFLVPLLGLGALSIEDDIS